MFCIKKVRGQSTASNAEGQSVANAETGIQIVLIQNVNMIQRKPYLWSILLTWINFNPGMNK